MGNDMRFDTYGQGKKRAPHGRPWSEETAQPLGDAPRSKHQATAASNSPALRSSVTRSSWWGMSRATAVIAWAASHTVRISRPSSERWRESAAVARRWLIPARRVRNLSCVSLSCAISAALAACVVSMNDRAPERAKSARAGRASAANRSCAYFVCRMRIS